LKSELDHRAASGPDPTSPAGVESRN
jgi:hypothetical protein